MTLAALIIVWLVWGCGAAYKYYVGAVWADLAVVCVVLTIGVLLLSLLSPVVALVACVALHACLLIPATIAASREEKKLTRETLLKDDGSEGGEATDVQRGPYVKP